MVYIGQTVGPAHLFSYSVNSDNDSRFLENFMMDVDESIISMERVPMGMNQENSPDI